MNRSDRRFYRKIYIILGLCVCIFAGLGYLLITGFQGNTSGGNTAVVTPGPSSAVSSTHVPDPDFSHIPVNSPVPSETPVTTDSPIVSTVDTDTIDSLWKVVNHSHSIDESYVPSDLRTLNCASNHTQSLRDEPASALENMFVAAKEDGIDLYAVSAYRSYTSQVSLYYTYKEKYGQDYVDVYDCVPGQSEHQLGVTVDLGTCDHRYELEQKFDQTDAYKWLVAHASEYGYIERYPKNGEVSTGFIYAPWQWRYVGTGEAQKISQSGKTMEEYYEVN